MLVIHDTHGPGCTTVVPSGWTGYYHVIYENPEERLLHHSHEFHSEEWVRANLKDPLLDEFLNQVRGGK